MTIVVANTKGGVGKTIISHHVLPTLFIEDEKTINVYEIDDNNRTSIEDKKLDNLNYKSITIENMKGDIDQVKMDTIINNDSTVNIIDCGGGNDTIAVLNYLAKSRMKNLVYIVPTNSDIEQFENAKQTIELIRKIDEKAKIILIFNRAKSLNQSSIEEDFIGFYGSLLYGIKSRMSEVENQIEATFALRDTQIYGILKNVHKSTLPNKYHGFKYILENQEKLEIKWTTEGVELEKETGEKGAALEYFKQQMDLARFIDDVFEVVKEFMPLKEVLIEKAEKAVDNGK